MEQLTKGLIPYVVFLISIGIATWVVTNTIKYEAKASREFIKQSLEVIAKKAVDDSFQKSADLPSAMAKSALETTEGVVTGALRGVEQFVAPRQDR